MRKIIIFPCLILLAILVIAIPKFIKDIHSAQQKLSSFKTEIVNTLVAPVEYFRTGSGYTVLISHGITGGFDQGLGLAKQYVGEMYDVIAVSRFGYLKSPIPEDSSPNAQAEAYKCLLDELGIDKTFILGNSAGTAAAVKFALKYPDRCKGLILVSANVPTDKKVALPPKPVIKTVFGSNLAYWTSVTVGRYNMLSVVGLSKTLLNSLPKEQKDELLNGVIKSALPVSSRSKGIFNDFYLSNPDINKEDYKFEEIKVPVIMLHAKDDTLCSYTGAVAVSKRIPDVKFVDFETGGHLIMGHEKEIQEAIANFTRTVDNNLVTIN